MSNRQPEILDLIGNTPMIEVTRFDTGPCRLFLKLESQNPGGSTKDRIARSMIAAAEKDGRLKPGGTIVEATAGNTGLGLSLIGTLMGYKVILVMPDKMSREKMMHCKALGAEVRLARSDVTKAHPEYYQNVADKIAREIGAFYVNQFANPANPQAHEETTGPEIWAQMEKDVDAMVCGVGSGGTLTGLGRFFAKQSPKTEMVLADPVGSILEPLVNRGETVESGSWLVEGIGEDFIPDTLDISLTKKAYAISDEESISAARELLKREGILAGPSSGTLFAAALKYCREQTTPKRVVTLVCDRGDKYLSKTFSDFWMCEQGFTARPPNGTVEDLIIRRHDCGDTVTVRVTDTLATAYKRMRASDVSQLPVLEENGRVAGVIDEKEILDVLAGKGGAMSALVASAVCTTTPQLPRHMSLADALHVLQDNPVALVTENGALVGVVTRVDMLNHLYLKKQA